MIQKQCIVFFFLFFLNLSTTLGQKSFTIVGSGQKIQDGDSLFLSYKENDKNVLQTAIAFNKKFTFTGLVKNPIKANIYRNSNPKYADFIADWVAIYIEPGTVKVNSIDTLSNAVISGTSLNDTLQLLQNLLSNLKDKMRTVKDPDFFNEEERKDTALLNHCKRELEKIFFEGAEIRLAFAVKYPQSRVSLDILDDLSRINTYIFKVEKAYNHLAEYLKKTERGNIIGERIKKKKQLVPGMKAIDFTMKDINGKTITLTSFKGTYILLDFWASWCGPCREEHPNLIKAYDKYKNSGFTVLSISIDTDRNKWIKAIEKDKVTWTQISDLKGNEGEVFLKYGITSIPANFLIDPNGIVIAKDLKGDFLKSELVKILSKDK